MSPPMGKLVRAVGLADEFAGPDYGEELGGSGESVYGQHRGTH
jgi:hypothetical protein